MVFCVGVHSTVKFSLLVPHDPPLYTLRWQQNETSGHNIPTMYISNIILHVAGGPSRTDCTLEGFDNDGCVNDNVQLIAM